MKIVQTRVLRIAINSVVLAMAVGLVVGLGALPALAQLSSNNRLEPARAFVVLGPSSSGGWSWCLNGPMGASVCDLNVSGVAVGGTAADLVSRFVESINAAGAELGAQAVATLNVFTVRTDDDEEFTFCVGAFGQQPTCCVVSSPGCLFDSAIRELTLAGLDSDGNDIDDAIDAANKSAGVPSGIEGFPTLPTVSEWGLVVMTLAALSAGTILFGRRRRLSAT